MNNEKSFPAKILLFGEYSIVLNGKGLAIPYPLFEGKLTFFRNQQLPVNSKDSNTELKSFLEYIKNIQKNNRLSVKIDTTSLEFDIDQGLYFDSSIPQGFGVGSSGALVAAIYERYAFEKIKNDDIPLLKNNFAKLESHFHGESSGLDPLICYLNKPLKINGKNEIGCITIPPENREGSGAIFLLSTNRPHKTEHLVNLFLEKCSQSDFKKLCEEQLNAINNEAIDLFLSSQYAKLVNTVKKISVFQYQHFLPMIPKLFQDIWLEGLENNQYFLKLCGAGGGGFILGFTHDFELTKKLMSNHHLRIIYRI